MPASEQREITVQNYNNKVKGERPSPSLLIPKVLFPDLNKLKVIQVTNSVSSTHLVFDVSGFEEEVEKVPAA